LRAKTPPTGFEREKEIIMSPDVYLICDECKGITNAISKNNGIEMEDFIHCTSCAKDIKARLIGRLSIAKNPARSLYIFFDNAKYLLKKI
jgi:hypothetical protein